MKKSMINLLSYADLLSIINALFGFLAIFVLFSDIIESSGLKIHLSLSLIFIGLLIDGIDGIVARRYGSSKIGEYLESMADMTSLSIAPAFFIFFVYSDNISCCINHFYYLLFALLLFLSFAIIRLASFHIMKEDEYFVGLPASASTIILLILSYFKIDFVFILAIIIIIGAFMASNIPFPKPGIKINGFAFVLIVLTIIFDKNYYGFTPILLLSSVLIYCIIGPIYLRFFKKNKQKGF